MAKETPVSVKKQDVEGLKSETKKEAKGTSSHLIKLLMPHILIVLAALFVYAGTLNYGYIKFDDDLLVQKNASFLQNMTMKNIQSIFLTDAFLNPVGKEFYRPLQTLSFMVDMQIDANNPVIFHISNFIFHCLACIALFHLLILLKFDWRLSSAGVVLYAVHPLFCMAVTWIPGRGDLLLGACVATSFICFIKSIRSTTQIKSKLYLASTLFFYALAIFSKETGIVLPVILTLYYFLEKGKKSTGILIKDNLLLLSAVLGWLIITILWYVARDKAIPVPIAASQFGIEPFFKVLRLFPSS